tara:strand:+ start:234 stop:482 length:249 start_codon:yes stop_codon:yes gene_type:complete
MTVGNFRKFGGKMFKLVSRLPYVRSPNQPAFTREFFSKAEAKERAKKFTKEGRNTRIVSSSNVSKYGGDIAYFLFAEMKGDE